MAASPAAPDPDCRMCPRLAALRDRLRAEEPGWHNAPVPSFGGLEARLLVVGLAPGRGGANRTGRPFTGDAAGDVLYPALRRHGFATGAYRADPGDGRELRDCRISNAVRCLPPGNRPAAAETAACRTFLTRELAAMESLQVILALGRIAHGSVLAALGARQAAAPFAHGARHRVAGLTVADSYHCSRYNMNTGRLTEAMFDDVLAGIARALPWYESSTSYHKLDC